MKTRNILLSILCILLLTVNTAAAEYDIILSSEDSAEVVQLLFGAMAGTTEKAEKKARKGMTEQEEEARTLLWAQYREAVKPFLIYALMPKEDAEEASETTVPVLPQIEKKPSEEQLEKAYTVLKENEEGQKFLARLEKLGAKDMADALEICHTICQQWIGEVDENMLRAINSDYAVWLYSADTSVDYPVVHGEDNIYYLDHLFNYTENACGTLFMDYRNLPEFKDKNTLIYGHHMRNHTMFYTLTEYDEQGYFEAHPYLLMFSDKEICLLEVFAGYLTWGDDHAYDIAVSDKKDFRDFVNKALEKSDFNAHMEILDEDHLITLSTCSIEIRNARYIVMTRRNVLWQQPEKPLSPWDMRLSEE